MRLTAFVLARVAALALAVVCVPGLARAQQLNEHCTVSVLNRNVRVNPDGSWVLPNVPANFGLVRARATCIIDGETVSGESEPFRIPPNGAVNIPRIVFGHSTPIPSAIVVTASSPVLTEIGATAQLLVMARYPIGPARDVTASDNGTQYTVSNPAIATVSGDGVVRAVKSGTVLIQAIYEGASGLLSIQIAPSNVDTDGDGIPDEAELGLGLDPQNPVDAQEDFDRDGLSNLREYQLGTDIRKADTDGDGLNDGQEVALGTSPLVADTDGDGVRDGLEVQTGSNPLDATSYNLDAALSAIAITPSHFVLTFNTIMGEATTQLLVTGSLRDGTTINLTSTERGTNYASSDLNVCNFSATDGLIFAGDQGSCTITATAGSHTATASGEVHRFAPTALSSIDLNGQGLSIDVSGAHAYVAVGSGGLRVVDVSDRTAPHIEASLGLPGTANDVKLAGSRAYVAGGDAGLHIVDVSNPLAPQLLGTIDTPGDARDVRVSASIAYVADGPGGLQIIDVSDPRAPRIVGTFSTGNANGVDVAGTRALVANGANLMVIDVSAPAAPALLGSVGLPGDALDVVAAGAIAYVADYTGSLQIVDFSNPAAPVGIAATQGALGGYLLDVTISGTFVFGADVFFVNGVPIIDVSTPAFPAPRAILNFPGDSTGQGIAADGSYVYLVGDDGRLYIGQYRLLEDLNGIPPAVLISSPPAGTTAVEGEIIPVTVAATDDVAVTSVTVTADGTPVSTDTTAPYQFSVTAPVGATGVLLGASAVDLGANVGVAANVLVNVIPDPLTTVVGRVLSAPASGGVSQPIAGASVSVLGRQAVSDGSGAFSIAGVPTVQSNLIVTFTFSQGGVVIAGVSAPARPVRGGTTDVGDIIGGAPPMVNILSPAAGSTFVEGERINVTVAAADDGTVARVRLLVNGSVVATDDTAPYQFTLTAPAGATGLTFGAAADDTAGNTGVAADVHVIVIPDPLTTVVGRVLGEAAAQPVEGATVTVLGRTAVTDAAGVFSIAGVSTAQGPLVASAAFTLNGTVLTGASAPRPPVRGGITDVGDIAISSSTFETDFGTLYAQCDDCSVTSALPFAFPFYGASYQQAFVNNNGNVTFQQPDGTFSESIDGLLGGQPRIAASWNDLIASPPGSGLYINSSLPGRFVVTWLRQAEYCCGGENTIQLILFEDGRIQFGYRGVSAPDAVVGVSPGGLAIGDPRAKAVDFSANLAVSTSAGDAIYEQFVAPNNPFDLDGGFLRFTPNAALGYDVRNVPDAVPPTCAIATPLDGATVYEGVTIPVAATASDNFGVRSVLFQSSDGSLTSEVFSAPYATSFAVPIGIGTVTFTVTATDGSGNRGTCSATVATAPAPPPAVTVASLTPGSTLVAGATIPVSIDATGALPVARVDLSINGATVASDATAPFEVLFTVPAGVTALTAHASAVDSAGNVGVSADVALNVVADPLTTVSGSVVDASNAPVNGARATLAVHGVTAEIFDFDTPLAAMPDLTGLTPSRTKVVSALSMRNPGRVFGPDPFGFGASASHATRLTAKLQTISNSTYTFSLGVNSGGRLTVNGVVVVDLPAGTGQFQEGTGNISLPAGPIPIEILMFDNGTPEVQLSYALPGSGEGQPSAERRAGAVAAAAGLEVVSSGELVPAVVPYQTTSGADGTFALAGVPTVLGDIGASARFTQADGAVLAGRAAPIPAVAGGTTDLGTIVLRARGTLFGTSSVQGPHPGSLFTIDTETGIATFVGTPANVPNGLSDVSTDPTTGAMYVMNGGSGRGAELVAVDPETAQVISRVAVQGGGGSDAIAHDATGLLYVGMWTGQGRLLTVNPLTGQALGDRPVSGGGGSEHLADLAVDPLSGELWASRGGNFPGRIEQLNPLNAVVVRVIDLPGSPHVTGIAFDNTGQMYVSLNGDQLARVDRVTGAVTVIGSGFGGPKISGLGF